MGIESFYLNVELQELEPDAVSEIMRSETAVNYYSDENSLCLQGALVCFFPACEVMYKLLEKFNSFGIVKLISRKEETTFEFKDSLEFFCWMYDIWKEKLSYFNSELGAFLVKPSDYYETRRKLKKYYVKNFVK